MSRFVSLQSRFRADHNGAVAIVFVFALLALCLLIGLSVDGGRALLAKTKAANALDTAALAATRALMQGNPTDAELTTMATAFFTQNVALDSPVGETHDNFTIAIDRVAKVIRVSAETRVPTTFGRIANVDSIDFTTSSQATFGISDIELGLVLDTTGSMNDASNSGTGTAKIDELKVAAGVLFDTLLPDNGPLGNVRIGIAPFSASVNAGVYAGAVSNNTSTDGCVVERQGADAATDSDPVVAGASLQPGDSTLADIDPTEGLSPAPNAYACPNATVMPLTSDKSALKAKVDGFQANFWTSGHLGTAWGWYLVSPNWSKVWPVASAPRPYGTANLVKAIVVMTDGIYNTAYYNGSTSANQAIALCNNAKAQGVAVYTIGFTAPAGAEATLKACASVDGKTNLPNYYHAESQGELSNAFKDIAVKLTQLRLNR